MSNNQLNDLSKTYLEAVYGGAKKEAPKDDRMVVTNADKKANTKAYQNMKAGNKAYKPADHLKDNYEFARHKASVISRGGRLEDAVESWNQKLAYRESMNSVDEKKVVDVKDTYNTISSIVNNEEYGKNSYSKKVMGYQKGGMVGKKKKHGCASKVKHEEFGIGNPVKGMHDLDENGKVAHYDVLFDHGVEKNVPVSALEIIDEAMHEHVIHDYAEQKKMDPVGQEDDDIDNDGDVDSSDKYLHKRRKAIGKAMGKNKSPESIEAKRRKDDDLAGSPMKEAMMAKKYQKGGMVKGYQKGGMVKGYQKGGMVKGYQKGGMVSKEEVEVDEAMMSMKGYQKGGMVKKYQKGGMVKGYQKGGMVKGYQKGGMVKGYQKGGMVSKEELSNWRDDLIEVSDTVGSGGVPLTDVEAGKKVKEGKVNNKVVINPKLGEAIEQMGGELIEVQEEMNPKKKKKGDQLEVAMEKGKQAIGTLGATTKGTSYAEEDEKFIQKAIKRPGAFTRKAKAAGMSVQQFAKNVDDNPDKYSTRTKRQANLAQTLTKLSKEDVEELFYTLIVE